MNFKELLILAKSGEAFAVNKILEMYKPLLMKEAIEDGTFDEDLYQELIEELLICIKRKKIDC